MEVKKQAGFPKYNDFLIVNIIRFANSTINFIKHCREYGLYP